MGAHDHVTVDVEQSQTNADADDDTLVLDEYDVGSIRLEQSDTLDTFVDVYHDGEHVGVVAGTNILEIAEGE